jgi:hypothetical protein
MAGRGKVTPADEQTNPRIFMLDKACAWVPAKDPVHFDKPKVAGVGLCSEFARCVAAKDPAAKVGLVPCAFGGTTLDQWKPGSALYTNAVARMRVALKSGQLKAILWHQGEGDSSAAKAATYPARFAAMIAQLRKDLGAPDVPVLGRRARRLVQQGVRAVQRDAAAGHQRRAPQRAGLLGGARLEPRQGAFLCRLPARFRQALLRGVRSNWADAQVCHSSARTTVNR